MNAVSLMESFAWTDSEVELEEIVNAAKNRVMVIRVEKSAKARIQVAELIKEHGYANLGLVEPKGAKSASQSPRVDKYSDPISGATWSGRGGKPEWVGDSKERFLNPNWVKNQIASMKKAIKSTAVSDADSDSSSVITAGVNHITPAVDSDDGHIENSPAPESVVNVNATQGAVETTPPAIDQPALIALAEAVVADPTSGTQSDQLANAA